MLPTIKKLWDAVWALLPDNQYSCRISEVNVISQEVIFHIINKNVFLKCLLSDAISNLSIINALGPSEACWLGGHFGKTLGETLERSSAIKKAKSMSFLLKNKRGSYRIVFQNRNGEIGYCNQKTKQEFIEHPFTIAANEYIVSCFDPSQACYIGILAGISMEKIKNHDKKTGENDWEILFNKRPLLRMVE